MVFLALTREGLQDALALAQSGRDSIWCSASAMSEEDFRVHQGIDMTRFVEAMMFDNDADVSHAKNVIEEHHPGQRLWIEAS